MDVPYFDLKAQYDGIRDEILTALDHVCRSAAFILGAEVAEFEREFAAYCEVKHCVALNSGTSALHVALLAAGVGPGDEVITTPNSFIATAEAISYTGARPVFADIDPATFTLSPAAVERAITPRTRAILPTHLYGLACDMDPILDLARRRGLAVVEDAAEAHGARYRTRIVGGLGQVGCFSFYGNKIITTGEGGMCVTDDDALAERLRLLRDHGMDPKRPYWHEVVGFNYRMTNLQAAVGVAQVKRLHGFVELLHNTDRPIAVRLLVLEGLPDLEALAPVRDAWVSERLAALGAGP